MLRPFVVALTGEVRAQRRRGPLLRRPRVDMRLDWRRRSCRCSGAGCLDCCSRRLPARLYDSIQNTVNRPATATAVRLVQDSKLDCLLHLVCKQNSMLNAKACVERHHVVAPAAEATGILVCAAALHIAWQALPQPGPCVAAAQVCALEPAVLTLGAPGAGLAVGVVAVARDGGGAPHGRAPHPRRVRLVICMPNSK